MADVTPVQTMISERTAPNDSTQNTEIMSLGVFKAPDAMQGVRSYYTSMNIDGISGNTRSGQNLDTPINMDAVAEVKVLTSNYQAEYGKASGSVINIVTKGGGREFHGGAYYYNRNEAFNANNFMNNRAIPYIPRQRYRYNTTGYNAGGPVYWPGRFNSQRDKLFFFFSQEILPNQQPNGPRNFTVPQALERTGNFSQTLDSGEKLIVVKDPLNGAQAFPGNIVPANRINADTQKMLNTFPLPNATDRGFTKGQYNFQIADTLKRPVRQEIARIDYNVNSKLRTYFRGMNMATHNKGLASTTNKFTWGIGEMDYATTGPQLGGNITYVVSPTLVNEFTMGYAMWTENQFVAPDILARIQKDKLGIKLGQIYPANNPLNLLPSISFASDVPNAAVFSYDGRFPMSSDSSSWSFSDGLGKVHGAHLFKAGAQFEYVVYNQYHNAGSNAFPGGFNFSRSSNNPLDANPKPPDAPTTNRSPASWSGTSRTPGRLPGASRSISACVSPTACPRFPATTRPLPSCLPPGARQERPRSLANGMGVLTAPRFGFAYDVFGDGKTAIRGGFGLNYNPRNGSGIFGDLSFNPPLIFSPTQYYGTTAGFLEAGNTLGPSGFKHSLDPNMKAVAAYNGSFGIQRNAGFATVFDVAYVGSFGRHIGQTHDINMLPYGTNFLPSSNDATNGKPLPANFLRPYQGYAGIPFLTWDGNSSYHSLETQLRRRFSHGLQFGIVWTWAKAMASTNGDKDSVATYVDRRVWNYGVAGYDRTSNLTIHYLYDIPRVSRWWNHKVVKTALDGWRPDLIARAILPGGEKSFDRYFNTAAFARPAKGAIGTTPSSVVRGPGVNNWNLSLFKNLRLRERLTAQFRAEAYNAFNHAQFNGMNTSAQFDAQGKQINAQFGQITGARDPRVMQFALRLRF